MTPGRYLRSVSCLFVSICLLWASVSPPAAAGRLGDIPVMDEFAAGMRAVAALDPDEKVRNPDHMAKSFLTPAFWFWTALNPDYEKARTFIKFYRVSTYYEHNACTKHIDHILKTGAGNGLRQVVIIGAGLDSRAYRFLPQMPDLKFWEVDLPAAVARKKELVETALKNVPGGVAYVPVNYRKANIHAALKQKGYDEEQKTLFICEGITRYMEAAAMDRLMEFVAGHAPPGSQLVFDYIMDDIARGDYSKMPWARYQALRVAVYGHPWKFGIAPDKAGEFVGSRGFKVVDDLGAGDLAKRYLVRSDGSLDGKPAPYFRIMHAAVK